jgi:hypothetical protein
MSPEEVLACIQPSVPIDLSLATVIPLPFLFQSQACRMVWLGSPYWSAVVHHAPSIRLGDLDFHCTEFESHRHLRVSINVSIVGEFATIPLTLFVRDPFLCYIPHRRTSWRHPWWNASSLTCLLSVPSRLPECTQSLDRACDGIDRSSIACSWSSSPG